MSTPHSVPSRGFDRSQLEYHGLVVVVLVKKYEDGSSKDEFTTYRTSAFILILTCSPVDESKLAIPQMCHLVKELVREEAPAAVQ